MAADAESLGTDDVEDSLLPRLARLRRRQLAAPDTWTLDLEAETWSPPPFAPGQFNMLLVPGVGEIAISFSGDPASRGPFVHTIRAVGAVSSALTRLRIGDQVGVRGPFGVGWPMAEAVGRDVVLVAGGLGLAPLRPAIYRLLAERERFGRIVLLFGTRSPDDIVFRHEVEDWRKRLDIAIEVTVDHAVGDWRGHVGVVTQLIPRAAFDPPNALAFVCGPEVMMRFAAAALADAGLERQAIYISMERNMKCAVGHCGHCQFSTVFVCKDGPVFSYDRIGALLQVKEL
jgi:NAD(P)H-flavin reductase